MVSDINCDGQIFFPILGPLVVRQTLVHSGVDLVLLGSIPCGVNKMVGQRQPHITILINP